MKVLNFEDSVYKANAIRKILGNRCGVASVEQVSNVEDGLKMLKDAEKAGEKLVQILQAQGNQTNIIVCSSRNMKLPGVYGCIWYSEISDWEEELCDLVREMEKSK